MEKKTNKQTKKTMKRPVLAGDLGRSRLNAEHRMFRMSETIMCHPIKAHKSHVPVGSRPSIGCYLGITLFLVRCDIGIVVVLKKENLSLSAAH